MAVCVCVFFDLGIVMICDELTVMAALASTHLSPCFKPS